MLSICGLLAPVVVLLLLSVSVLLRLLVRILVTLVLLRGRRVRRVAAVRIVALVILALRRRGTIALLVLLIGVVGRCLVCALALGRVWAMRPAILIVSRLSIALPLWWVALIVALLAVLCAIVAVTLLAVAVVVVTGHAEVCYVFEGIGIRFREKSEQCKERDALGGLLTAGEG